MSDGLDFSHVPSCLAVTDDVIEDALAAARSWSEPSPRQKTLALVEHMTRVAKPGRGAPKILVVLAHMAHRDWLDGELRVRLIGDTEVSVLELLVDDGLSHARILGPLRIDVSFAEFARALSAHPELVLPLEIQGGVEERRVELLATPLSRSRSVPPSMSAVSRSLIPVFGDAARTLPNIISHAPPSDPPDTEQPVSLDPADLQSVPVPRFKPVSLPPRLRAALEGVKKKP